MPFPSSPLRGKAHKARSIRPFVVIPMLAVLLTIGALAFSVQSEAAPAKALVRLTARNLAAAASASSTWYFDGGSVGNGFQEYLTIQNPDPSAAANVTITYLLQANPPTSPTHTRTATHIIPAATRQTIDVDHDLGTSPSGPHTDAAAIVQVTSGPAVIVERPWYFNNLGVNSGTDTFGVITPQKTFYFAEADSLKASKPGQPAYNTYVSVLNPSSSQAANVTITYYTGACGANGQAACLTQQVSLAPLQRQVLTPTNHLGYHQKFSIEVSGDNAIVAERLMYVKDNIANAGGFTTGAIMGAGATAQGTGWLFAEGYTGSGFQEYYELANFGQNAAHANIKLEYTNGDTQTLAVTVPALGYYQFDVNNANAHPGTCVPSPCQVTGSVSAEITSDNPIVAERMMYFHFGPHHISGTTDVVGTPAAQSTYAFAEGYTLGSFNEFLTVQNPTSANETVTVTYYMTTTSFSQQYTVVAHSRLTVNVNNVIASRGGGAVSMLVQAQGTIVAERPMYFIYGSAQGGTDVIGFTGN